MNSLLEVNEISVSYPIGAERRRVLQNISFSHREGAFLSILGPSGCGKTTLLKTLGGFIIPDKGIIIHRGRRVTGPESSRLMIFQESQQLFPWMTVLKNTAFPLAIAGLSRKEREAMAKEYLAKVGLPGYENAYPRELSGGMKQRVVLARALITRPDLLLMDEPFVSLDAPSRKKLQGLLHELWEEFRLSVLYVTHEIEEALALSQEILIFNGPGLKNYPVNLPWPRNETDPSFIRFYDTLYAHISQT